MSVSLILQYIEPDLLEFFAVIKSGHKNNFLLYLSDDFTQTKWPIKFAQMSWYFIIKVGFLAVTGQCQKLVSDGFLTPETVRI